MKVINLFGGPGAGKSTTASELFALMKRQGLKVELVTEFAKDLTWEARTGTLTNQLYVLGKQDQRLRRLVGQVDWAITDSPLLLAHAYAVKPPFNQAWFHEAVDGAFRSYENRNVYLHRVAPYAAFGRSQTEAEADEIGRTIERLLADHEDETGLPTLAYDGDEDAAFSIFGDLVVPVLRAL